VDHVVLTLSRVDMSRSFIVDLSIGVAHLCLADPILGSNTASGDSPRCLLGCDFSSSQERPLADDDPTRHVRLEA
jgi:hypothetical protein